MDSSQVLFIYLKVSQILVYETWPAKQPNPGLQPAGHTLGDSTRSSMQGTCFATSMLSGRERNPATWVTHILGGTHGNGTGGHTSRPRAGYCCPYPPAPPLEHPPSHNRLPASVQVTAFIFALGNEIQSHTNNCVCFPYRFQSGIASY